MESRDTWTRGKTRINTNLGSHYFDLDTSVVQLILPPPHPQHSTIPGYLIHCILSRVLLLFISAAVMERPSVSAGPLVRVRMDCDVSPLSNVTPGPTINLSLTRLSEMSWVRVTTGHQSPDVHICCGAHSADTVIPALIYCHRSKGCSDISTLLSIALMALRILFTTYLLCANFYIFPICSNRDNSMKQGNVSCH